MFLQFRNQCEKRSKVREEFEILALQKQNWQEITTEIPTLEKLGFDAFIRFKVSISILGGENQALKETEKLFLGN
jgi:deoxyribodipyrimidine photo-lyase